MGILVMISAWLMIGSRICYGSRLDRDTPWKFQRSQDRNLRNAIISPWSKTCDVVEAGYLACKLVRSRTRVNDLDSCERLRSLLDGQL
jgi:hypothetical protein